MEDLLGLSQTHTSTGTRLSSRKKFEDMFGVENGGFNCSLLCILHLRRFETQPDLVSSEPHSSMFLQENTGRGKPGAKPGENLSHPGMACDLQTRNCG